MKQRAGEICVKRLLAGERGHYGPMEHAQIVLNVGWFPAFGDAAGTHTPGWASASTCNRCVTPASASVELRMEILISKRCSICGPIGDYSDRQGKKYQPTPKWTTAAGPRSLQAAPRSATAICCEAGFAEEHARGILPFDYRQHFVVSFSLRAFLHFMDLRGPNSTPSWRSVSCATLMWPHMVELGPCSSPSLVREEPSAPGPSGSLNQERTRPWPGSPARADAGICPADRCTWSRRDHPRKTAADKCLLRHKSCSQPRNCC